MSMGKRTFTKEEKIAILKEAGTAGVTITIGCSLPRQYYEEKGVN